MAKKARGTLGFRGTWFTALQERSPYSSQELNSSCTEGGKLLHYLHLIILCFIFQIHCFIVDVLALGLINGRESHIVCSVQRCFKILDTASVCTHCGGDWSLGERDHHRGLDTQKNAQLH